MITQILAGVFLFGLCIFFHELGHYLIGKWVGIQPKIFSIGYGKGIWFKKVGRTIYQVTAIPLGGYVQFYGDDPTKEHSKRRKGDFFAASPWRRIATALGGPAFSILLGFLVIFALVSLGWQPSSNEIVVLDREKSTPAQVAGLKTGDRIIEINGEKTDSFEKIHFNIAFGSTRNLNLKIERDGQVIQKSLVANETRGQYWIGITRQGKRYVYVSTDPAYADGKIRKGDRIKAIGDVRVHNRPELTTELNRFKGKVAPITIIRKSDGLFTPTAEETLTVDSPVAEKEYLHLTDILDLQTQKTVPELEVGSWQSDQKALGKIFINEHSYTEWSALKKALQAKMATAGNRLELRIGAVNVRATVALKSKGMLGFMPGEIVEPVKAQHDTDLLSLLARTYDQTIFSTKSTLLGLYRLIEGRLSFSSSVSGPIRIFAFAAESVQTGWENFWFLLANITIILGIMNLLPIPVLDGGHIVFYLIEGVYRPLPAKAIGVAMRLGMATLLSLGLYVIVLDLLFVAKRYF